MCPFEKEADTDKAKASPEMRKIRRASRGERAFV